MRSYDELFAEVDRITAVSLSVVNTGGSSYAAHGRLPNGQWLVITEADDFLSQRRATDSASRNSTEPCAAGSSASMTTIATDQSTIPQGHRDAASRSLMKTHRSRTYQVSSPGHSRNTRRRRVFHGLDGVTEQMATISIGTRKRADHLKKGDWVLHGNAVSRVIRVDGLTVPENQRHYVNVHAEITDHASQVATPVEWMVGPHTEFKTVYLD